MNAASSTLPAVLAGLMRERGPGLLGERRRLLGLLRDRLPGDVRAIRILMMAFDGGVPGRLAGTEPSSLDIGREGGVLSNETGLGLEVARQAVETWAVALCGYASAAAPAFAPPATTGPRPSVRKLPPKAPGAPSGASGSAPSAAPPRASWSRRWPGVVLGLVVLLGALARLFHHPAESPTPQQPPAPSTPAAPGTAVAGKTPEGYALVAAAAPFPSFTIERVDKNPNTLGVWFGVKVGDRPVSYYVAYAFDKGQRQGQGLVGATQNGQKVGSGVVTADRILDSSTGKSFLRVAAPMQQNAQNLPGLCTFAQVADTLDRLDLVPDGLLAVFGVDDEGGCDTKNRLGLGTLK